MKYELYPGSLNDIVKIKETVFKNRNYSHPVGGFYDVVSNSCLLKNIDKAVSLFVSEIEKKKRVDIVVDCDVDGYASASILYRYITENYPDVVVRYHLHSSKKHGLSDDIAFEKFKDSLLILPDSGTNDVEQCASLVENNVSILVLDHHIAEVDNPYALIVNSTDKDYPNNELCGTGVVWQFIRELDEHNWTESADECLDVVALATVSDIMDVTVPENRVLIDMGLSHIRHPLIDALANKVGIVAESLTGIDVQFNITPMINAMVRVGSLDEKEILFKAFCCEYETFDYKKRGSDEVIEENIYDRAARLCYNAKNRQNRSKDVALNNVLEQIENKNLASNRILVVNGTEIDGALTGVIASQLADKFNKPCLVLRKQAPDPETNEVYYSGSGRNSKCSVLPVFRDELLKTGMFEFVSGHDNAFGVSILNKNVAPMIQRMNEVIPDTDPRIYVDFVIDSEILDFDLAVLFVKHVRRYCGEGFPEPLIAVERVEVRRDQVQIMGKEKNSWKIVTDNDIEIVKFKVPESDAVLQWYEGSESEFIYLNIVGSIGLNQWCGKVSAQMVTRDYSVCC